MAASTSPPFSATRTLSFLPSCLFHSLRSVPEEVAEAVDMVTGLSGFPEHSPKYFVQEEAALATYPITPQVLRQRYNVR